VLSGKVARRRLTSTREEILRAALDAKRSRENFLVAMRSDFRHLTRLSERDAAQLRERARQEAKQEEKRVILGLGAPRRRVQELLGRLPDVGQRQQVSDLLMRMLHGIRGHGEGPPPSASFGTPPLQTAVSSIPTPQPAAPLVVVYSCPMCTFVNQGINEHCEVCDHARPSPAELHNQQQQQQQQQSALERQNQQQLHPAVHWACGSCTLLNEPTAGACALCTAVRPQP
jgi:hypothetical protein